MVSRRVALPLLVVLCALLAPGQALATPQFVPSTGSSPAGRAPDVTADTAGDSAAAWYSGGHVYVSLRPRGGPWGPPDDLQPDMQAADQDPKIAALPDGELVAAWVVGNEVHGATRPPGGGWSKPQTLGSDCCVELSDAVAGADGTALVFWNSSDGTAQTAVKPAGAANFDPPQALSLSLRPTKVALAPDGSALAAAPGDCGSLAAVPCVLAQYRPRGRTWGTPELVSNTAGPATGLGVAARSGPDPFTVAWGERDGSVRGSDRSAAGAWALPLGVPGTGGGATPAGCASGSFGCFDLAGRDDALAVVWQAGTAVTGSVRGGSGGWSARESVGGAGTAASTGDADTAAAIAADGAPFAAWTAGSGGVGALIRGAHRSGAGSWQAQELGSRSGVAAVVSLGDVAADGQGDGLAGFSDTDGSRVAGFDGSGPRFTAFSLPSGGSLTFSAAAEDNWSGPPAISWLFGDGTGAPGGTVSHAYGSAGAFTATATATDAAGNATEDSGPVFVTHTEPPPCGTQDTDKDGIGDGCDTSDGALKPTPFKTVNATVVSGDVLIKLPGASAAAAPPKGFVPLEGAETIPVGATLDTTHGRVKIRSASDTRGRKLQIGQFFRGRFVVRQVRIKRRSKKLVTDMRLTGSSFSRACGAKASIAAARKRSRKRVRRLFGVAKGSFRTSGRTAAATVRGTRWGVQDRCDGTLVTVQRGRVEVRDKVRRKTIVVRTGHAYLARAS